MGFRSSIAATILRPFTYILIDIVYQEFYKNKMGLDLALWSS